MYIFLEIVGEPNKVNCARVNLINFSKIIDIFDMYLIIHIFWNFRWIQKKQRSVMFRKLLLKV